MIHTAVFLEHFLYADQGQPKDVLNVLNKMIDEICFQRLLFGLQTIPVRVAKGEPSFSELKIIKTHFKSTIAQEKNVKTRNFNN